MKALISGVAGDIGFGVGRILKDWGVFDQLIGIDLHDDHPGKIIFNKIEVAPRAESSSYMEWLHNFIMAEGIDVFIPTSEAEILVISKNINVIENSTKVLINNEKILSYCLDKHRTLSFLESNNIKVPAHGILGSSIPLTFPSVVKPQFGQGSKGLKIIHSLKEIEENPKNMVWQDLILPEDQEYTCAIYVSKDMNIHSLQIRRTLSNGFTGKGEITNNRVISDYLMKIVLAFNLPGCYNIQLRLTPSGPLIFEINPRLSSTLVFRDKLGFTDLRWWLSDLLDLDNNYDYQIKSGTKIFRGNFEYIIDE